MPNVYDIQKSSLTKNRYGHTVKNPIVPSNAPYMKKASGISIRSGGWAAQGKAQFLCTDCKITPQLQEYLATKKNPDQNYGYDLSIEELKRFNVIDNAGNYKPHNQTQFDKLVQNKYDEIAELKKEIAEREKDKPEDPLGFAQGRFRLVRGNKVSDSRCENPFGVGGCGSIGGDYFNRKREEIKIWNNQNIRPLQNKIANLEKEILVLDEKSKLPLLRQQLITATSEFEELSPNDPEFRQKQIEQKKSLYKKAVALDTLERKHNLYGNLPTRPQQETTTITAEPIIQTEFIEEPINYKLIGAGAAIGLIALFLIWRFK